MPAARHVAVHERVGSGQTWNTLSVRAVSPPLDLDETIRADIWTSDTPEDLARRVQQAIGESSSPSDELRVSHTIAPDPRTRTDALHRGHRPPARARRELARDLNAADAAHGPSPPGRGAAAP